MHFRIKYFLFLHSLLGNHRTLEQAAYRQTICHLSVCTTTTKRDIKTSPGFKKVNYSLSLNSKHACQNLSRSAYISRITAHTNLFCVSNKRANFSSQSEGSTRPGCSVSRLSFSAIWTVVYQGTPHRTLWIKACLWFTIECRCSLRRGKGIAFLY